jgi:hypothetical protein
LPLIKERRTIYTGRLISYGGTAVIDIMAPKRFQLFLFYPETDAIYPGPSYERRVDAWMTYTTNNKRRPKSDGQYVIRDWETGQLLGFA